MSVYEYDCAALTIVGLDQCDQIGWFLKIICVKVSFKFSPNVWRLYRLFENIPYQEKLLWLIFGQLLEFIGPLLISTAGHTGLDANNHSFFLLQKGRLIWSVVEKFYWSCHHCDQILEWKVAQWFFKSCPKSTSSSFYFEKWHFSKLPNSLARCDKKLSPQL